MTNVITADSSRRRRLLTTGTGEAEYDCYKFPTENSTAEGGKAESDLA